MADILDEQRGTPERVRVKVRQRRRIPRRGRRSFWRKHRWPLLILGLLGVLAVVDGSYAAFTLDRDLHAARVALARGADEITDGQIERAGTSFAVAEDAADRALSAANHPVPLAASILPFVGDDVRAVRSMSKASVLAGQAGGGLVTAARASGWDGRNLPGFRPGGRIDLELVQAARPGLTEAAGLMKQADAELAPVNPATLLGPVRTAVEQGKEVLSERASQAEKAAALANLLPGFLGADGDRSYLLVMMNLSDPRGAGGYPGSYGLLHADGKRIALEELEPTSTIPKAKPPVAAPEDVQKRYALFGATTTFIATTYSPDFPTDARLMQDIWGAAGRPAVDGVIAADSVWMSYLLDAVGPVAMPEAVTRIGQPLEGRWPSQMDSGNVIEVMDRDTFLTTDINQQDDWQSTIGDALWQSALEREWAPSTFGSALSRAVAERHVQVYADREDEQQALADLGATGEVELPTEPPLVTFNGFVPSRAGYYSERTVDADTVVNDDGSKTVTVNITMKNTAPTSPESILLGLKSDGDPIGLFVAQAATYIPADAKIEKTILDGSNNLPLVEQEFGHKVVLQVLSAKAGDTSNATVVYTIPAIAGS